MYYSFKKICFLTITSLSLSFISCSSEYDIDNEGSTVAQKGLSAGFNTDTRSYEEALTIAQNSISMVESSDNQTRSTSKHRSINEKGGVFTVSSSSTSTRTGNVANDTLFYVFNFNDDQGFAVVSANRNTEGLLAITESGFYSPNKETDNPGFNNYMEMAKLYVQKATKLNSITRSETYYWRYGNDTLDYYHIEPKVQIKWGQEYHAATYCSNGKAGCAPIAAAQIMSYFKRPSSFTYTFNGRDKNFETVDWNQLNQHPYVLVCPTLCDTNPNINKMIGRICRQIGEKANSEYVIDYNNGNHTNTSHNDILSALRYYGYSTSGYRNIPNTEKGFLDDLQNNKLILMYGKTRSGIGHAWIVDGGFFLKVHSYRYKSLDGVNWETCWDEIFTSPYNHVNWGLDGSCNGFFIHAVFDANSCIYYDKGSLNLNGSDLNFYKDLHYSTVY